MAHDITNAAYRLDANASGAAVGVQDLPTTLEGKVLAAADAMFHLQTSFFPIFCCMHRPEHTGTYEEWQEWFNEKIERDHGPKIFFEDERAEVKEDYEALSRVFRNKTMNSRQS